MFKMKNLFIALFTICMFQTATAQQEVGSGTMTSKVSFGGESLVFNGGGVRKKAMVLKLYSGALYLVEKSSKASQIMDADETMAIKLHITSSFVSSEAMSEAVIDGFEASTGGNVAAIQKDIDTFIGFFSEEIVEDNVFDITYEKGGSVVVYKNDKRLGSVGNLNFKKALFGIWLGNDPADSKLKKGLLGK